MALPRSHNTLIVIVAFAATPVTAEDSRYCNEVMENLATQLGCDINRLPRLVGTGEGRSEDGAPLKISYQLVAPLERWLVGRYQWRGGGVTMTRSVDFKGWSPRDTDSH